MCNYWWRVAGFCMSRLQVACAQRVLERRLDEFSFTIFFYDLWFLWFRRNAINTSFTTLAPSPPPPSSSLSHRCRSPQSLHFATEGFVVLLAWLENSTKKRCLTVSINVPRTFSDFQPTLELCSVRAANDGVVACLAIPFSRIANN